jgi:ribosomal protein S18 acetylase RimI-like enzyme
MAALSEARFPDIVELRDVAADELSRVLEEEKIAWRSQLQWDFTASADLVRRFVRIQALNGFALVLDGRCIGYTYFVSEDRKALIGDVYVVREYATAELEDMLLGAVLDALVAIPAVRRIEAQLMMLHGPFERSLPYNRYLRMQARNLMMVDLEDAARLPSGRAAARYVYAQWSEDRQDDGAQLIAAAYRGHVDSTINDQYRSVQGARRFLNNIVQYPGCGAFNTEASWVADTPSTGRMAGLSLASLVAAEVGHVTQICVAPEMKGTGAGYELLRRTLNSLAGEGCIRASLTVTASNQEAVQLYQNMGFRATRRFAAYVWDGF